MYTKIQNMINANQGPPQNHPHEPPSHLQMTHCIISEAAANTAEEQVLPASSRPANSEGPSHCGMFDITVNLRLHAH